MQQLQHQMAEDLLFVFVFCWIIFQQAILIGLQTNTGVHAFDRRQFFVSCSFNL